MLPHAATAVDGWKAARAASGRLLLALDFDGTLAPIAPRPQDARIPQATRATLAALAARGDTRVAIISGRALADVADKVGVAGLYYAGNHGLELHGPGLEHRHETAAAALPALRGCVDRLEASLSGVDGVLIEDKGLTVSVHYRLAREGAEELVGRAVEQSCGGDALRVTRGKKVFEIRPAVDWDKGKIVRFLIDTLLDADDAPVVFIGDDATDEDAFLELAERGAGVIVADPPPPSTHARYYLPDPADVGELLTRLAR